MNKLLQLKKDKGLVASCKLEFPDTTCRNTTTAIEINAATTSGDCELGFIAAENIPAEPKDFTAGYLDEKGPSMSKLQHTFPKLKLEKRCEKILALCTAENTISKLKLNAVALEWTTTLGVGANTLAFAVNSVKSIVRIAKSFAEGANLDLVFENNRSPSAQIKIALKDIKINNAASVLVSEITASTVCFAEEYEEAFSPARNMQIIKSGEVIAEVTAKLSEYVPECESNFPSDRNSADL